MYLYQYLSVYMYEGREEERVGNLRLCDLANAKLELLLSQRDYLGKKKVELKSAGGGHKASSLQPFGLPFGMCEHVEKPCPACSSQAVQHSGDTVQKHPGDGVASLRFQLEFQSVPQMSLVLT